MLARYATRSAINKTSAAVNIQKPAMIFLSVILAPLNSYKFDFVGLVVASDRYKVFFVFAHFLSFSGVSPLLSTGDKQ